MAFSGEFRYLILLLFPMVLAPKPKTLPEKECIGKITLVLKKSYSWSPFSFDNPLFTTRSLSNELEIISVDRLLLFSNA